MNGLINAELVRAASAETERRAQTYGARDRLARPTDEIRRRSTLRRLVRRSQEVR